MTGAIGKQEYTFAVLDHLLVVVAMYFAVLLDYLCFLLLDSVSLRMRPFEYQS